MSIADKLKTARFFVFQHKDPDNENLLLTSLVLVTGISGGVVVFWATQQDSKAPRRTALPMAAIVDAVPIPDADIEASAPRGTIPLKDGIKRQMTDYEYYTQVVCPFMLGQGLSEFYAANK